jgi:hypothetical protein
MRLVFYLTNTKTCSIIAKVTKGLREIMDCKSVVTATKNTQGGCV